MFTVCSEFVKIGGTPQPAALRRIKPLKRSFRDYIVVCKNRHLKPVICEYVKLNPVRVTPPSE